jgi:hypothetical protein
MAKKYLLYIHEEQFDLEDKKSELVNSLLRTHYAGTEPKLVVENAGTEAERKQWVEVEKPTRTKEFCKNGHPIPEGRDRCLGKGCKYS